MDNRHADQRILDAFWPLAEGGEETRLQNAVSIIHVLEKKQKSAKQDICSDLEYCTTRLIKGLASNRKFARLSYAMLLTLILRRFKMLELTDVVGKIEKYLKLKNAESKTERLAIGLGRVTAYQSLVQSDMILQGKKSVIKQVADGFVELCNQSGGLSQISHQAIAQLASKLSDKQFTSVWPIICPLITKGWTTCKPNELLLLLQIQQNKPDFVSEKFLKEHWYSSAILSDENWANIATVVTESTKDHPAIHSLCTELVDVAIQTHVFKDFWKHVIQEKLWPGKVNQKYLCLHLAAHALKNIITEKQVKFVLSRHLIESLNFNLKDKKLLLHAVSGQLADSCVDFVRRCTSGSLQMKVIKCLIGFSSPWVYCPLEKTINAVVLALNDEGAKEMFNFLKHMLTGPEGTDFAATEVITRRRWAIQHLKTVFTLFSVHGNSESQLQLLQLLFLHSFFIVKSVDNRVPHCETQCNPPLVAATHHTLQAAFYKSLSQHRVIGAGSHKGTRLIGQYLEMLYGIMRFAQQLLSSPEVVTCVSELSVEVKEAWEKLMAVTEKIHAKVSVETEMTESHAFLLLFQHIGLQLFSDQKNALDVLKELNTCYEKSLQRNRRRSIKKITEDELPWVEVVTDMFLSLLSQNSHLVRLVVTNAFTILIPHLTSASVKLIIDVLRPAESDEDGPLMFEDNEDTEMEKKVNGVDPVDESEDSSSSESEAEEEEVDVDDGFRETVKAALGKAAAESEEESDSDLSDSAMFQLDNVLSEAFRSRQKGKQRKKEQEERNLQLIYYKQRCIDLVAALVTHNAPCHLLLDLIFPMLEIMEMGVNDTKQKQLADRASSILSQLCKLKKLSADPLVEKEMLPQMLNDLIQFSKKASSIPLIKDITSSMLFVVRVLLGFETDVGPSPVRTRSKAETDSRQVIKEKNYTKYLEAVHTVIGQALKDYCEKRDSHLNQRLFHDLFFRQFMLMWPMAETVLNYATSPNIRTFCKTQMCALLVFIINRQTVKEMGDEYWCAFSQKVVTKISQVLLAIDGNDIKPKYFQELMLVLHRVLTNCTESQKNLFTPEVKNKIESINKSVKGDCRAVINKVLKMTGKSQYKRATDDERVKAESNEMPAKKIKSSSTDLVDSQSLNDLKNRSADNDKAQVDESAKMKSKRKSLKRSKSMELSLESEENSQVLSPKKASLSNGASTLNGDKRLRRKSMLSAITTTKCTPSKKTPKK